MKDIVAGPLQTLDQAFLGTNAIIKIFRQSLNHPAIQKQLDANGNPVADDDINEILVSMAFDTSKVTPDQFRTVPGIGVYYADTMADLAAGKYTGMVPVSDIVDIDYANGWITFRVNHLTAFGVGATSPSTTSTGSSNSGGGGGGCFIGSAAQGAASTSWLLIFGMMLVMPLGLALQKKK